MQLQHSSDTLQRDAHKLAWQGDTSYDACTVRRSYAPSSCNYVQSVTIILHKTQNGKEAKAGMLTAHAER